jgi:hypothetical protein
MVGMKKRRQRKRKFANKINNSIPSSSSQIITKNLEIFVTDFLIDPCGLPLELKDCVLVDGTKSLNENSGFFIILKKRICFEIIFRHFFIE